jgi:hypothetical protein
MCEDEMKKWISLVVLFIVLILAWVPVSQAQTVIRILNGYVLFDSWEGVGKLGDQVEVLRKSGDTDVPTGKVKLLLFRDGMASGKIVIQDKANPVRVGDVVRRSGTSEKSVPKTLEPAQAPKQAPFSPAASSIVPEVSGRSMKADRPVPKSPEPARTSKPASSAAPASSMTAASAPSDPVRPDSAKTVLRVVTGYVLVDPGKEPWKEDSVLRVIRKTNRDTIDVGDLRVVKRENGRIAAKIVREREPYKIAPGDAVTSVVQDFDIDSYFFGAFGGG